MKKVLILTAGFGEGHNAAARNVRDALELLSDEVKVEVLDLFEATYGSFNTLVKKSYLGLVQYAPSVWGGLYHLLDNSEWVGRNLGGLTRLRHALGDILRETQPDVVVSTYPVYAHVIQELFRDHHEKAFRLVTIVTDSITVNSAWFRAPSDLFCVPNEETAAVMKAGGLAANRLKVLGFPVSPAFARVTAPALEPPLKGSPRRVLYIINTGKKKSGKVIDRLLDLPDTRLTITVGRDAELKAKLAERTAKHADRVEILGWTNHMPQLMLGHHLVITKAGGATVQEAIAARCPLIVNQVIPGQEEGNARLVSQLGLGAIAQRNRQVSELVEEAFSHKARQWSEWRENLARVSRPDASLRIAELILAEADHTGPGSKKLRLFEHAPAASGNGSPAAAGSSRPQMLLCDFHIHTNYSDGKLSVPEVVDFYGHHGFDCICITDHLADPRRLIGKLVRLSNLVLGPNQLEEYFEVVEQARQRAWRKYRMLVLTGIEFNKDGYTKKSSAHLLGLDLKSPIRPDLDLTDTITEIHAQGGLAVASHPHVMKSHWGKNTLHLWQNQETFAPLLDAWEIANRNDIFNPVGLKRLPFIANSDFHKPKHIYSWKTLLHCEKDPAAIKACIRRNKDVSITLYRDFRGEALGRPAREEADGQIIRLLPPTGAAGPRRKVAGNGH
jgi:UDP-N-acetylglucosamine:LPS N-acetylglucosamine transferase